MLDFASKAVHVPFSRAFLMATQLHIESLSEGEIHHHTMVGGARLVERCTVHAEAAGSNPVAHPNFDGVLFS